MLESKYITIHYKYKSEDYRKLSLLKPPRAVGKHVVQTARRQVECALYEEKIGARTIKIYWSPDVPGGVVKREEITARDGVVSSVITEEVDMIYIP